jgi:membrane dipeptidase
MAPSPLLIQFLLRPALMGPSGPGQRLQNLLRHLLIIDTHIDAFEYMLEEGYQLAEEHSYYETDIPRLRRGNVGAVFFGIYALAPNFPPELWVKRTLESIDALQEQARLNSKDMAMAFTADDIVRLRRAGKIAALMGLEGGHLISGSLPVLRDYYRLGVRYMTLTHFNTNDWADSANDKAVHNGLSPWGREVIREMNRLGMMIDVSHASDKTFYDALETSRAPLIASHSGMRALCNIPRNMSDDMLRALARKGGVVSVIFAKVHLDESAWAVYRGMVDAYERDVAEMLALNRDNPRRWEMKRAIQQRYKAELPPVDISAVLRHIDHAVKTIGTDHVGVGSDFDGISGNVLDGLEDVSKYPALVQGLIDRGYSDTEIRKIMGENLLRVMRANEAVSSQMAGKRK